jgi:plasmid stabilization system protein ParE
VRRLFVLTPEARNDLKQILLDFAEDSPDPAERLRLEFYEGLQGLGRSPGIGHYHD